MSEPRQLVTIPGPHKQAIEYAPEINQKLIRMAAEIVKDLYDDRDAYTQERAAEHRDSLLDLITVSCSCNQPKCGTATNYVLGLAEGLRMGSLVAMSAGLADQLRMRRDNAPLLPSEIKLVVQMPEGLAVTAKPSAGVLVEYGEDGKISGTRPRPAA